MNQQIVETVFNDCVNLKSRIADGNLKIPNNMFNTMINEIGNYRRVNIEKPFRNGNNFINNDGSVNNDRHSFILATHRQKLWIKNLINENKISIDEIKDIDKITSKEAFDIIKKHMESEKSNTATRKQIKKILSMVEDELIDPDKMKPVYNLSKKEASEIIKNNLKKH